MADRLEEAPTPPPLDGLELVAAKDEAALDVALVPNEAKDTPNDAEDSAPPLLAPVVEVVPAAAADLADMALAFVDPCPPLCSDDAPKRLAVRRYSSTTRREGIWSCVAPVSTSRNSRTATRAP